MKILLRFSVILSASTFANAAVLISGATGNGNFETVLNGATGQVMFSSTNVANWTSWTEYDSAANDTGVTNTAPDRRAFLQPGPNIGTNGGAIRSTISEVGTVGKSFTYGFDYEGSGGNATMVLLYVNSGGSYVEIPGTVLRSGTGGGGTIGTYTQSFSIAAGTDWLDKQITVGFRNSIAADGGAAPTGQYPNIDNVVFSSAIPEPAAALLGAVGSLLMLRRRR